MASGEDLKSHGVSAGSSRALALSGDSQVHATASRATFPALIWESGA